MKNLCTIILAIMVSTGGYAQLSQGMSRLGGCIKFSTSSSEYKNGTTIDGPTTTSYQFNPVYSYLISDKWEIGGGIGIKGDKEESVNPSSGSSESTSTEFFVKPFVQYDAPINEKFYCIGRAAVMASFGSYEDKFTDNTGASTSQKGDVSDIGVHISPGLSFFPSNKFSIDFWVGDLGFDIRSEKPDGGGTFTETDFGLKYNYKRIGVGASYFLGAKAE